MPIVKISAKSRHGFVMAAARGFVVSAKGVDVDTETPMFELMKPYIDKGILLQDGKEVTAKTSAAPAKVVKAAPAVEAKKPQPPVVDNSSNKNKQSKKNKAVSQVEAPVIETPAEPIISFEAPVTPEPTPEPAVTPEVSPEPANLFG